MKPTRRDHSRSALISHTLTAFAHLHAATDARVRYDRTLQEAIKRYGDRHTPRKLYGFCITCGSTDINHTTSSVIAGIYSDHFPDEIKTQLRFYASLIGHQTDIAVECWKRAGRRIETLRPYLQQSRVLPDGRISYY